MTSACHAEDHGFKSRTNRHYGSIAQLVEQRTENPRVTGSIPVGATMMKYPLFDKGFILQKWFYIPFTDYFHVIYGSLSSSVGGTKN